MKILTWQPNQIDMQLIDLALLEDLGKAYCDITTQYLFKVDKVSRANIVSKHPEPIVICGLAILPHIFKKIDPQIVLFTTYQDGEIVLPNATLLTFEGLASSLLRIERVVLNYLQRLCAIATLTNDFVCAIKDTQTKILDTRKTQPGLRHLEKYAVQCGGGVNHRMGLYDAIMVKDTHSDILGNLESALDVLPEDILQKFPVIVEVRNMQELMVVLNNGLHKTSRILLDNMPPKLIEECVQRCARRIPTEASGNIDLDNVKTIAECGVDFISVGKLTHSAGIVDLSMKISN